MVLTDDEGRTFTVAVDPRFLRLLARAGVGDVAPVRTVEPPQPNQSEGQRTMTQDATREAGRHDLTPRDIQSRVRAGQSAEQIAEAGGMPIERVTVFAAPVLAERAHVAQGALGASVRRRSGDAVSEVRTLGPAAALRLRDEGVDPEGVDWDAWRREDGRWTLIARYHHDGDDRQARFCFDQPGNFVTADDDEGRWLIGDGRFPSRADRERAQRTPQVAARYDEQLPLGDDALELVREEPVRREPDRSGHPTLPEPGDVAGDADWIAPVVPVSQQQVQQPPIEEAAPPAEQEPAAETTAAPLEESAEERPRRRGKRASVPSWDEIMFGGG